ncbi:alpha/beta hydrolase [Paenibacillus pabuli]|uniref:alpha/beta hydrolase n=1 Tax=Paenibacillus pabuli TaxID=1472 RepID=UPI00078348BB|nr:alpha/beta hydrolase fold domain-containing protein [Paenibacillus pabuli]MEC0125520.1 alpha/beta hydrolase fold domain-containing protein [Paenibacillus pabuli]
MSENNGIPEHTSEKKSFFKRYRVAILIAFIAIAGIGALAYYWLNTAGGTKVSKLGVMKIRENAITIRKEANEKDTLGKRIVIERDGKDPVEAIWYEPEGRTEDLPVFVYAHGGAWISFDAIDGDEFNKKIADSANCVVVNLNYRLLQTEPFPYQQEEMADTVKWLQENAESLKVQPDNIVISGGSAGGHITAGAALLLSRENIKVAAQLLEMPFLDFTAPKEDDLGIFSGFIGQLHDTFFPDVPTDDPIVSPPYASAEELKKLPPAYFILGKQDPLHLQGERYAKILEKEDIYTNIKYFDTNHGYTVEKKDENGETVSVADIENNEAGEKYKIELLQSIFNK